MRNIACCCALLALLALSMPVMGYEFQQEIVVAAGITQGRVNINVFGVNQVDIVHKNPSTVAVYSCWDGSGFSVQNQSMGLFSHEVMGISRYGDMIYVGHNSSKNAMVSMLGPCSSTWTNIDTGYDHMGFFTSYGGFAVDPCTGLGAMLFKDSTYAVVFLQEQPGGTWTRTVLEPSAHTGGNAYTLGAFTDMVFTPEGVPVGTYQAYDPVRAGNRCKAGEITGVQVPIDPCNPGAGTYAPLTDVRSAFQYMHGVVTAAADGTLYLLDGYHTSAFEIFKSEDTGATWTLAGRCYIGGSYSAGYDDRLAVSADESTFAVVRSVPAGDPADPAARKVALLVSTDGYTWETTWLPGSSAIQVPDVAFDDTGYLYVAYNRTATSEIVLLTSAPAQAMPDRMYDDAAIAFTRTDVIASGDDVHGGHVKIDVSADGIVDVLWVQSSANGRYSCWDRGVVATDSTLLPYTHGVMGISRDDGVVRLGINSSKNLVECTRVAAGDWVNVNLGTTLGYKLSGYTPPCGGYDVNPATGRGAFLFLWDDPCDTAHYASYVYKVDQAGTWAHYVLDESTDGSYGRDATLVFDGSGTPFGGFRYANGTGRGMQGGAISGPGPLTKFGVSATNAYQYCAMTLAPSGTLYSVLHCYHSGSYDRSYLFKASSGGVCGFTQLCQFDGMDYDSGASMDSAIAVAPDESLIAVLMNRKETVDNPGADPNNALVLYTTVNNGSTWERQWLPGGAYQEADLGFDAAGNLYVVYYDQVADALKIMTNIPPFCGDAMHPYPTGDLNRDCYVNEGDLAVMAEKWLACTDPGVAGCVQLDSPPAYMYIPQGTVTVDGTLSAGEWPDLSSDAWINLNVIYSGEPRDIVSAKFAMQWNEAANKVYIAVVAEDEEPVYETTPTNYNTSDRIELYTQGDPNGGMHWGADYTAFYDKAQQYVVGGTAVSGNSWAYFGNGTYIPVGTAFEHGVTHVSRSPAAGHTVVYEAGFPMYMWYGEISGAETVVRDLAIGDIVGLDPVIDTRYGWPPHTDPGEFGMLSANKNVGSGGFNKYIWADTFQKCLLVESEAPEPSCGDWGYLPEDLFRDCVVDLADFAVMAGAWLDCTAPDAPCNFN